MKAQHHSDPTHSTNYLKPLLSVRDTAELLDIPPELVIAEIDRHHLPAYPIGGPTLNNWYVPFPALLTWLAYVSNRATSHAGLVPPGVSPRSITNKLDREARLMADSAEGEGDDHSR
jgi:hypothetical protein